MAYWCWFESTEDKRISSFCLLLAKEFCFPITASAVGLCFTVTQLIHLSQQREANMNMLACVEKFLSLKALEARKRLRKLVACRSLAAGRFSREHRSMIIL